MKKRDLAKFRSKSILELGKNVFKLKKELAGEGMEFRAGKKKNPKKMRNLRKDIAQFLTLIREKEIIKREEEKNKGLRERKEQETSRAVRR